MELQVPDASEDAPGAHSAGGDLWQPEATSSSNLRGEVRWPAGDWADDPEEAVKMYRLALAVFKHAGAGGRELLAPGAASDEQAAFAFSESLAELGRQSLRARQESLKTHVELLERQRQQKDNIICC